MWDVGRGKISRRMRKVDKEGREESWGGLSGKRIIEIGNLERKYGGGRDGGVEPRKSLLYHFFKGAEVLYTLY
jgi:hypothetical protein